MKEKHHRRVFTRKFKIETVELYRNGKHSAAEIPRDLGINKELIYRWNSEYQKWKDHSFSGAGHMKDPEEEKLCNLERALLDAKVGRDMLKKTPDIERRTAIITGATVGTHRIARLQRKLAAKNEP